MAECLIPGPKHQSWTSLDGQVTICAQGDDSCRSCHLPLRGQQLLCERHRLRLLDALRQIPTFATEILANQGRSTSPATERVSSTYSQPLPGAAWLSICGPSAEEGYTDDSTGQPSTTVLDTLASWCRLVGEERDVRSPDLGRNLAGIHHACTWLAGQLDWITLQPWCDDLWTEVTDVWRSTRTAASHHPNRRRGLVPCGACGMRALTQPDTGEDYRCQTNLGGCGNTETESQHEGRIMETDVAIQRTKARRTA